MARQMHGTNKGTSTDYATYSPWISRRLGRSRRPPPIEGRKQLVESVSLGLRICRPAVFSAIPNSSCGVISAYGIALDPYVLPERVADSAIHGADSGD